MMTRFISEESCMQRVEDALRQCAERAGANTGFGVGASRITHADLDDRSERLAGMLQARDVMPNDRAVIFMEAKTPALVAAFGSLKAGAIVCPVGASATAEELTIVLNETCATCLFVDAGSATVAVAAMAEAPLLRLVVVAGAEGAPAVDGLIRYEDAVEADRQPLMMPDADCETAMLLYPKRMEIAAGPTAVTHSDLIDGPVSDQAVAASSGEAMTRQLIAAIASLRQQPRRDALPDAAA
jgi:acyl-CoA synthetase (AMP-forming)/AMP-acid ligase II